MRKHVLIALFLALATMVFASQGTIKLSSGETSVQLTRQTEDGLGIQYKISELGFKAMDTKGGAFTEIFIKHYATTNKTGYPQLPLMRQIIQVPVGATVIPHVTYKDERVIALSDHGIRTPLLPRQESIAKNVEPATVPFLKNAGFYAGSDWTDEPMVQIEDLGYMRGVRMVAVDFVPVRYNPATQELRVISDAEIGIDFVGSNHLATQELRERTYSPAFESIHAKTILNYTQPRATLNRYPMGYVIITPQMFVATLQPFIEWKKREGYNVILATTEQVGATTTAIKSYLQNLWDTATTNNPAPSFLLLVGDTPQIPAYTGTTGTGHVTDLTYVRLQGTDFVPEMYYGRFSATNVGELQPQIDKSMMHQQYTMPDDSYLGQVVMIAGVDSSYGNSHANGQINYGTNNYFNATQGITSSTFLYPGSGSQAGAIVSAVSQGKGYVNYTAHGSETSWADPSFTISNVNSLQNANKYPVVVGNCCVTNHFNTALCFGEAWLRAANKGAVIYIGGNNNTYWDEDYYWGVGYKPPAVSSGSPFIPNRTGVYDAMFHTHNEPFEDWTNSAGATVFMGNMAVVQSNSTRINYYWEIYSIMGDPSTVPYLGIPETNPADFQSTLFLGLNTLQINGAAPYSYVAISMNNVLHGVGLADASGNLILSFVPFEQPGTAQLVMTRLDYKPLITNITVVPNTGAYVLVNAVTVNDGNNNIAEAGETIGLDVSFNNVGSVNATNLTAIVTTDSPYITIVNGSANFGPIPANGTINVENAFSLLISPMIPDQTQVNFQIEISDGSSTWTSNRSIVVNAPNVVVSQMIVQDGNNNGFYESGETVTVSVLLENTGSMSADGGSLIIVNNSPYATLTNETFVLPGLAIGGISSVNFGIILSDDIPDGTVIGMGIAITAGMQMINHTLLLPIGIVGEGFESGTFTSFPWINNSNAPWTLVTGADAYAGTYAAKTGTISHNGSTTLQLTLNVGAAGNISFYRRVSSESNYDFLKFYIDETEMGSWSGNQAWAQFTYPVNPGNRTFKWTYSKDGSVSNGSDCGWIDEIVFPAAGSGNVAIVYTPTQEIEFIDVPYNSTVSADFVLRNLGNVPLTGAISSPNGFTLMQGQIQLPSTHNYSIPANEYVIYTLSYSTGQTPVNIEDMLTITSNDQSNPVIAINVTLNTMTSNEDDVITPVVTKLHGNYPNPFNPETTIRFSLKDSSPVRINIYNIKGQLIRSLVNNNLTSGNHQIVWNGKDNDGRNVGSGIYLYRMESTGYNKTLKMMLMK